MWPCEKKLLPAIGDKTNFVKTGQIHYRVIIFQDYETKMAIKIIKSISLSGDKVSEQTYKDVRKEIDKLLYFELHSNIVNVLGVLLNPHGIVLELAPIGDLKSVVKKYQYRQNLMCCTAVLLTIQQVSLVFVSVT